ncbi:MAG TPA: class I SAM-dependent methyltransferase [Pseudonocardiaceae bacterium]|nr:class I SAM-dependent methyltransferase [Pseudonocardiaceae bacterium]
MLDYSREAAAYDATRGGAPRANAAAAAIQSLLPPGVLVDVAGGTGIVASALAERGYAPIVLDRAPGMAVLAGSRLPGRVAVGDATALPFADASVDAVTMIWLLHLLPRAVSAAAIGEAARVLRPGGTLVTTVDKNDGQYRGEADIEEILWPHRVRLFHPNPDDRDRIAGLGASHGLRVTGAATFAGLGQARSPKDFQKQLRDPSYGWVKRGGAELVAGLTERVAALSDQDRPRGDPVYRLLAMTKD